MKISYVCTYRVSGTLLRERHRAARS